VCWPEIRSCVDSFAGYCAADWLRGCGIYDPLPAETKRRLDRRAGMRAGSLSIDPLERILSGIRGLPADGDLETPCEPYDCATVIGCLIGPDPRIRALSASHRERGTRRGAMSARTLLGHSASHSERLFLPLTGHSTRKGMPMRRTVFVVVSRTRARHGPPVRPAVLVEPSGDLSRNGPVVPLASAGTRPNRILEGRRCEVSHYPDQGW
jgi:hypothetical protein